MYTIPCLLLIQEEDLDTLAMSSSAYVYVSTKYTMPHASCVKTAHNAMSFGSFQEHLYRIAASSEAISAGLFGHWPVHASGLYIYIYAYIYIYIYMYISSCLRQVPPPCQPSTLDGDCSNDDGDADGGDDDGEEEGEEACHMWRFSF